MIPPAAARFTALVPGAGVLPIVPIPILVPSWPPTFASAVPKGEGEGCRSLLETITSFPPDIFDGEDFRGCGGEILDADFRATADGVIAGAGVDNGKGIATLDVDVEGDAEVDVEASAELDDDVTGMSNSTGRTRGVACTLVINLARSQ